MAKTLTVKYKDGEKKVVVTPQTMIAAAAPGKKDELKAGRRRFIIFGWDKQPDGSILAKTMYWGRSVAPAIDQTAVGSVHAPSRGRKHPCRPQARHFAHQADEAVGLLPVLRASRCSSIGTADLVAASEAVDLAPCSASCASK